MREILNKALDYIEKLSKEVHRLNADVERLERELYNYAMMHNKDEGFSEMVKKHKQDGEK
jgi:hypothetical protein